MVDNYAAFFNCTPVGRASDAMIASTKLFILVGWGRSFLSVAWPTGVQLGQLTESMSPRFLIHHGGYCDLFVCP